MMSFKKLTLFAAISAAVLGSIVVALAFTGPTQAPPSGGGVILVSSTFVGIGTATPLAPLHIESTSNALIRITKPGVANFDISVITGSKGRMSISGGDDFVINANGNVGIGTTDPGTNKLYVNGATYIAGNLALGANSISLTGNISNVNKLTVTTIDPLYEIGGMKYATYGASIAGGVKEEYVGRGKLAGENAEYMIDFKGLGKGSDLWVWYNAVDFNKDNIEVLATAYGSPAGIWYEIDGQKIIFHGTAPAEFSYRLVGKRHDWRNWPTLVKDQSEKPSFIIK